MSVIGYLIQCEVCSVRMIVTADAKYSKLCPECFSDRLLEAIEEDDEHSPYTSPLLPWELELLGRNDDDDYPIGQVRG